MAILSRDTSAYLTRSGGYVDPAADWCRSVWAMYATGTPTGYITTWVLRNSGYTQWAYLGTTGSMDLRHLGESDNGGGEINIFGASAVPYAWAYLTLQYDASETTLALYVDGVQVGTDTVDLSGVTNWDDEYLLSDNDGGTDQVAVAYERIWQRVLTTAQILAERASQTAVVTTDLLASSPLDNFEDVTDDSGHGRNWTVVNPGEDLRVVSGPLPLVGAATTQQVGVVTISGDSWVRSYAATGTLTGSTQTDFEVNYGENKNLLVTPDQSTIVVLGSDSGGGDGYLRLYSGQTGALVSSVTLTAIPNMGALAYRENGNLLIGTAYPYTGAPPDDQEVLEYTTAGVLVETYPDIYPHIALPVTQTGAFRMVVRGDTLFYTGFGPVSIDPERSQIHTYTLSTMTPNGVLVDFSLGGANGYGGGHIGDLALMSTGFVVGMQTVATNPLDPPTPTVSAWRNDGTVSWQNFAVQETYPDLNVMSVTTTLDRSEVLVIAQVTPIPVETPTYRMLRFRSQDGMLVSDRLLDYPAASNAYVGMAATGLIAPIVPSGSIFPIRRLRRSPTVSNDGKRVFHQRFQVDFQPGVANITGPGSAPFAWVRTSDDGGYTWSNARQMSIGSQGDYLKLMRLYLLGSAYNRVYEVTVSDPVAWTIVQAWIDVEGGLN